MKLFVKSAFVGALLLSCANAFSGIVVVFDHQEAMLRTKIAQDKSKELEASVEFKQLLQEAEAKKADLEALGKEYELESMTWSEDIRAEKNTQAELLRNTLELTVKKIQTLQGSAIQEIAPQLQETMTKAIEKIQVERDIDLILPRQGVYFVKPENDITVLVAAEIDKTMMAVQPTEAPAAK